MSKIALILTAVLGIGLSAAWGAEVRGKTSPSSPHRSQIDSRMRRSAEGIIRQYDKNKNGVLDKDEWSQMPQPWRDADRNKDGKITVDELAARLAEFNRRGPERRQMSYSTSVSGPPFSPPSPLQSQAFSASAKPLDPHGPMVELRILVAELAAERAKKPAAAGPATAGAKSAGSAMPGGLVEMDLAAPTETLKQDLAKIGLQGRWESFYAVQLASADGQAASLNLGHSVPQITGVTQAQFGRFNSMQYHNTGFIVGVVPHVDPGGVVTVEVDVNNSRIGSDDEGVPIFAPLEGEKGERIVSHPIHQMLSRSVVRVPAGKTVVVVRAGREERGRGRELVILLSARVVEPKGK